MFYYLSVGISGTAACTDPTFIMSYGTPSWIVLAFLLLICGDLHCLAKTDLKYMTSYCTQTVLVEDSLLLVFTFPDKLPDDRDGDFMHCDLVLEAPRGMKLFSHILKLHISPDQYHSDRLHLDDLTANVTRLTPVKGLFGTVDRTNSQTRGSGDEINDYRTRSNKMKVDYLGKPTKSSPGFRLLVTTIQDPTYDGQCPAKHYLCRHNRLCIPRQLCCDGNLNCGNNDDGDENECDRYNTATDLLVGYSLTRDIIVVILLPLAAFIASAAAVLFCARRHIRDKIDKPVLPAVHFTPRKEKQIRISEETEMYAPPSYEDTLNVATPLDQPPTYNGIKTSEDCQEARGFTGTPASNYQQREQRQRVELGDSTETDTTPFTSLKYVNMHDDSARLHGLSPSEADDDESKINLQRKRGKGKVKGHSIESQVEVS